MSVYMKHVYPGAVQKKLAVILAGTGKGLQERWRREKDADPALASQAGSANAEKGDTPGTTTGGGGAAVECAAAAAAAEVAAGGGP